MLSNKTQVNKINVYTWMEVNAFPTSEMEFIQYHQDITTTSGKTLLQPVSLYMNIQGPLLVQKETMYTKQKIKSSQRAASVPQTILPEKGFVGFRYLIWHFVTGIIIIDIIFICIQGVITSILTL